MFCVTIAVCSVIKLRLSCVRCVDSAMAGCGHACSGCMHVFEGPCSGRLGKVVSAKVGWVDGRTKP